MTQLFKTDYYKPQYFNASFLQGGLPGGKSGHWRLFFYQLQEEEFLERNPPLSVEEKVSSEIKKSHRKEPKVTEEKIEEPPPKLKPLYQIKEEQPNYSIISNQLLDELHSWEASYRDTMIKQAEVKALAEKREAENDYRYRVLLLLGV